jgi:N-acetylmuramoyl-L-alanine amidase
MSAVPTRIDPSREGVNLRPGNPNPAVPNTGLPLQEGNRALELLARGQTLPSLLAFSALHEQIQRSAGTAEANGSTSDLVQTERFVLDEVLQLLCERTQEITRADGLIVALSEGSALVCRAGSGSLAVPCGVHLAPDSEILQEAIATGRVCSVDDCAVDNRAELDLSRMLGACSTVIVPLGQSHAVVGALQAFAQRPFAFSADDIRSFDFFGEMILSALKPKEQDRRLNWLADVADSILVRKPSAASVVEKPQIAEPEEVTGPQVEELGLSPQSDLGLLLEPTAALEIPEELPLPAPGIEEPAMFRRMEAPQQKFFQRCAAYLTAPITSRPGLSGVLALVAVAALFSAGVWWGMQNHVVGGQKSTALQTAQTMQVKPAAASVPTLTALDHLLDPAKLDNDVAPPAPASNDQLAVLPKITAVRHWSSSVGSTVVIDLEDQVPYEVHRLTSPERIYFDLHDTRLAPDLDGKSIDVSDSSLTRVRVAQPVAGVTRVVLDTRNGSNFSVSMESSPYRLVVELRDSAKTQLSTAIKSLVSGRSPQPTRTALLPPTVKTEDNPLKASVGRFHIVLDAGHGGWDLGTVGRGGLLEKDLVLDVTERLGKLLRNRLGADVIFTRSNDDYLPLDQRVDIANQAQADLFVSVHANYSKLESARGVETYYTNFFSAPGSQDIEKWENGTSVRPTPVALSTGELHEKVAESHHLAACVQRSLYATLSSHNPGIRDRGVKDSAFVVLTGTTMPAILTEISFVSSPADERNLQSESYRQQIAEALYKGISQYEAGAHHHVKMAQMRPRSAWR